MTALPTAPEAVTSDPDRVAAVWHRTKAWLGPLVRWAWGFGIRDAERVPEGPVLIVANHLSNLDPFLLGFGLPRPGAMMGKAEVFRLPVIGWIVRQFGAFPVQRGAGNDAAVLTATALVAAGWSVILYPEGTRNPTGRWGARRLRSGAARIALDTRIPIVPAAMIGTAALLPIGAWWARRGTCEVRFGPALEPEHYLPPGDWPLEKQRAHVMAAIYEAIAALLPPESVAPLAVSPGESGEV